MNTISNYRDIYKHITYIGSISCSSVIGILCLFLKNPNSLIGKTIFNLSILKSFFLYDSTIEVYIHHLVMLLFLYLNNPYVNTFNLDMPETIYYVKLGYGLYSSSVFSNLQMYLPKSKYKPVFKYLNYTCFIIYRYKFNKTLWNYNTILMLKSYYNNNYTKVYISYSVMFIISLINVYWTLIMIRNIIKKLKLKTLLK
jgi:hypothetical protein